MNARIIAASLASAFLAIGIAQASGPKDGHHDGDRGAHLEKFFEHMDADKDGRVTKDELGKDRRELFGQADENGDGTLTAAEYERYRELQRAARAERRFALLDRDGDGKLSAAEINNRYDSRFERMDKDGDGALTEEEVRESIKRWHGNRDGDRRDER